MLQRLIGLETEYALVSSGTDFSSWGGRYAVYRRIVAALGGRIPIVDAWHLKEGVFHAGGGAVWFETERPSAGGGLIEGASPECASPRAAVAWQRAQDELLSAATEDAFGPSIRLLKNDRDAFGNIYGAQENYEAQIASGWRLQAWRIWLVLLFPLAAVTWLGLAILMLAVALYSLAALAVYLSLERSLKEPDRLANLLFGMPFARWGQSPILAFWLEGVLAVTVRVLTAPLAGALLAGLWAFAFVPQRRGLAAFLATRSVVVGAGMLDDEGRFLLADKGPAINCLIGYGGLLGDRPVFSFGNFFKTISADALLRPLEYLTLFAEKQRLQIALGDSNLAQTAEYLRVATTALVLDVIEAGELPAPPRLANSLRSIREVCRDPQLGASVRLTRGEAVSALAVQRFYLEACRAFVQRRQAVPAEAQAILTLWEETLDQLENDPEELVGVLDWPTKRFLLHKAGLEGDFYVRKKIDLRYHELSSEGYFNRLREAGMVRDLLEPEEVAYARRNAPSDTPAAVRGRYIREFAGGDEPIKANWRYIYLGQGKQSRKIRLDQFRTGAPRRPPAEESEAAHDSETE